MTLTALNQLKNLTTIVADSSDLSAIEKAGKKPIVDEEATPAEADKAAPSTEKKKEDKKDEKKK